MGRIRGSVAAVLVGAVMVFAAFVAYQLHEADEPCFPGSIEVRPEIAAPGDTLTVSGQPFPCDRDYADGSTYVLRLSVPAKNSPGDRTRSLPLGRFAVAEDGTFTASVTLPDTPPTRNAAITVGGDDYNDAIAAACPANASCAGGFMPITILRQPEARRRG